MDRLVFGMHTLYVSQGAYGYRGSSHPNGALDLAGQDTGIDFWRAMSRMKCIAQWKGGYGTYMFTFVDSAGNPTKVRLADGTDRIVTLAMTHSNEQYIDSAVGKIYEVGQYCYEEGGKGANGAHTFGNHIHIEVAEGLQYAKYKNSKLGVWQMNDELDPVKCFFVLDGFTKIKADDGIRFKHCDSVQVKTTPSTGDSGMYGIDISNWQNGMDLSAVLSKTKTSFVIAKATEGTNFTDKYCDGFLKTATDKGKCIGVYHFARPENNGYEAEAKFFYEKIKKYVGKAILILDWESAGKSNVKWAKQWLDWVYSKTGIKPMIYMSESVVNAYDWSSVANAGYPLWVAKYRDNEADYNYDMSKSGAKPSIKYWRVYDMWQWTSSGILTGYSGKLDCNIFYGDEAAWNRIARGAGVDGWKKENGNWYYYKNGKKLTGWHELKWSGGQSWFYFNSTGIMLKGWQKLKWSGGSSWFYFDDNGAMLTGLHYLDWKGVKDWYLFSKKNGNMLTGQFELILTFDSSGKMTGGRQI